MSRKINLSAAFFIFASFLSDACLSNPDAVLDDVESAYLKTRVMSRKFSSFDVKSFENQKRIEIYKMMVDAPYRGVIRDAAIRSFSMTDDEADMFYGFLTKDHSKPE